VTRTAIPFLGALALAFSLHAAGAAGQGQLEVVQSPTGAVVRSGERTILLYRAAPTPMKPYVRELFTPGGVQILRDSPHDHKHHHGLMFALAVDGTDFWSEKPTCGRQVPGGMADAQSTATGGAARATFHQRLDWLTPADTSVLQEERTIAVLTGADLPATLLTWRSRVSAPEGKGPAKLTGAHYFGLGLRFVESMDQSGRFFSSEAAEGVLVRGSERVTPARWCAYTSQVKDRPVTVAVFDHPKNPRPAHFFTMRPFAYLAATLNLYKQPMEIPVKGSLDLRYGVAAWDGSIDAQGVETLYRKWLALEP
jgi:LacI family transcriptional regulator